MLHAFEVTMCGHDFIRSLIKTVCFAFLILKDPLNQGSRSALECNRSWLREARACLEKLLQPRCALVGLYLSMIIAMLGEGVAAENAFNFHMARYFNNNTVWI